VSWVWTWFQICLTVKLILKCSLQSGRSLCVSQERLNLDHKIARIHQNTYYMSNSDLYQITQFFQCQYANCWRDLYYAAQRVPVILKHKLNSAKGTNGYVSLGSQDKSKLEEKCGSRTARKKEQIERNGRCHERSVKGTLALPCVLEEASGPRGSSPQL
jgi:hypothetical protein